MNKEIYQRLKIALSGFFESFKQAFVIFLILYIFLWPVSISGVSMEPDLVDGNRVFISRFLVFANSLENGDIAMLKSSYDKSVKYIVKRIIASPGDYLVFENGVISVNGEIYGENLYISGSEDMNIFLEEGQYFVLGDNTNYSLDSRIFGIIHKKDIVGKVIFRWYPLNDLKLY